MEDPFAKIATFLPFRSATLVTPEFAPASSMLSEVQRYWFRSATALNFRPELIALKNAPPTPGMLTSRLPWLCTASWE